MFDYLTLPAATKKFAAKEFPSPTKIWATLNKREKAIFDAQMRDKNSAVYKAVMKGRFAHTALENNEAKDAFNQRILETFNQDIGIDIDATWAKEMGVVSVTHKYKGKFDGVGVFRGRETVWDYKKTNKIKTPSGVKKYLKQCAAYAIAHNEMYNSNIDQIAIFNIGGKTVDEITTRVFTYDLSDDIKQEWLEDVSKYWNEVQSHATLPV
jgi:hypothetical protein